MVIMNTALINQSMVMDLYPPAEALDDIKFL